MPAPYDDHAKNIHAKNISIMWCFLMESGRRCLFRKPGSRFGYLPFAALLVNSHWVDGAAFCGRGYCRDSISSRLQQVYRRDAAHISEAAIEIVKPIHPHSMPAILGPSDYNQWLNGSADEAFELLQPFDSNQMRIVRGGEGERSDGTE